MSGKVMIDGEDLFIRDTPDNIKKIEELLLDRDFIPEADQGRG